MSDLSWLNPPPHAIAVYASCSASPPPHATLASRRPATALPGPDFAPADRASFAWRLPSFDHLVGGHEQLVWNLEAQRLGGLEVDHKFILGRRLHRQVGRFLALEDAIDVASGIPVLVDESRPIGYQTASDDEVACEVDRGQFVSGCQRDDQIAMNPGQSASCYDQAAIWGTRESRDSALDLASVTHVDRGHFRPDRWRYGLDDTQLPASRG